MSDNWLQLVPTDTQFQPPKDAAERARELYAKFVPDADEVIAEFFEHVSFFHPGANWDGVKCPACERDIESWWEDAVAGAEADNFANLAVSTPCCGRTYSLNNLIYPWPAAFGRFVLEAMNPNIQDLNPDQVAALESAMGHKLRKIWVHI